MTYRPQTDTSESIGVVEPKYNRFKVALDIQDAGNMRAIAREFVKVVDDAMDDLKVTTEVWRDPAVILLILKLHELTGYAQFGDAYFEAKRRSA